MLSSCSNHTTDKNVVDLLYETQYRLHKNESVIKKRALFVDDFKNLRDSINAPDIALYKVIKHPDYTTYIAMDVYDAGNKELPKKYFDIMDRSVTVYKHRSTTQKNFYAIFVTFAANSQVDFSTSPFTDRFEKK